MKSTFFPPIVEPRTSQKKVRGSAVRVAIESIATGVPGHITPQIQAGEVVSQLAGLQENRGRIEKLYKNTRIDTRHLAIDLLSLEELERVCQLPLSARMQMFKEQAVPLAEQVTQHAIAKAAVNFQTDHASPIAALKDAIRMVVFVSSTGFIAPGIDTLLIRKLGLRRDVARVPVHFMGCAAAMNGLRVASDYVKAHPTHKALVVCLELSSIHALFADRLNDIIIHSIFSDGCAAVILGGCTEAQASAQGKVIVRDHFSQLLDGTEDGIELKVHEHGITCQLSRQLPGYIEAGLAPVIEGYLAKRKLTKESIDLWAVHPGGVRILEKAQQALGLTDTQVAHSWEVLKHHGNMLSASILFVLERILGDEILHPRGADAGQDSRHLNGLAFSFSPGVGIEGLLFQKF
jgi:alpha-pyrone synthase